jgi:hypothetical protein
VRAQSNTVLPYPEFALLGTEVPATGRALLRHGFDISAVHNHLINVVPSLYYIHASATGNPMTLAHTLRQILDQNVAAAGTSTGTAAGQTFLPLRQTGKRPAFFLQ